MIYSITFIGDCNKTALNKGLIIASAVNYSRDLGNHPANLNIIILSP